MTKQTKKESKTQFKSDFSNLRAILNKDDILGLMPHLPADEYDCINHGLLGLLYQDKEPEFIQRFLITGFEGHLGLANQDFIDKLTMDIYDWWNNRKKPRTG
jgi:hypothetical protein